MAKAKSSLVTSPRIEEIKRRKKRRIRFAILFYSVSFIVLVVLFTLVSRIPKLHIKNIEVNGTHIVDSTQVIDYTNSQISGRYLYLFDKKNAFIYPNNKIQKDLVKKFPRINNIDISLRGFHTIVIDITERTGSYLWCGASIPEVVSDAGDNCYFVNSDGKVFDQAPYFSGNVYFKFYIPIDTVDDVFNKQVLDQPTFQKVISFTDGLEALGVHAVSVVMNNPAEYAFHLDRKSNIAEPVIYFNSENDLNKIFQNFSSAMSKDEFRNQINTKYDVLQYIDLRFNNKVLYKFR